MRWTGSDLAAKELVDAGVILSVGTPGIQNRAMDSALERAGARPILVANEASAASAVAGIFEASEGTEIACANLIGGPGITHALAGIAIAHEQQVPMLVLTTGIRRGSVHATHRFQLHDVDNLGGARANPLTGLRDLPRAQTPDRASRSLPLPTAPPSLTHYAATCSVTCGDQVGHHACNRRGHPARPA